MFLYHLSFKILEIVELTRTLQSNRLKNPGGGSPELGEQTDGHTKSLGSNIGLKCQLKVG